MGAAQRSARAGGAPPPAPAPPNQLSASATARAGRRRRLRSRAPAGATQPQPQPGAAAAQGSRPPPRRRTQPRRVVGVAARRVGSGGGLGSGGGTKGRGRRHPERAGAAAVASFLAAVLTEICLCGICSCQETLRRNGRGQGGQPWAVGRGEAGLVGWHLRSWGGSGADSGRGEESWRHHSRRGQVGDGHGSRDGRAGDGPEQPGQRRWGLRWQAHTVTSAAGQAAWAPADRQSPRRCRG
eukprot:COSAG01_NODE_404_length_17467_cov_69.758650_8_plen_240_part_00